MQSDMITSIPRTKRMTPLVSICLPVFNGEQYLSQAIESALSQTFEDFELIIVDDASNDRTIELVEEFVKQDNRIKFHRSSVNKGLFANYNHCLREARGEYIKPFAQDDLLHPDALSSSLEVLENNAELSLVAVGRILVDGYGQSVLDDGDEHKNVLPKNVPLSGVEVAAKCLFPVVNSIGEPSTVMFARRAKGDGFDEDLNHLGDIEYWIRILLEGDLFLIEEPYAFFRKHEGSTSVANTRGILSAPDLVTMSRKLSWLFEACGQTEEDFLQTNILAFAQHMASLTDSGFFEQSVIRDAVDLKSKARRTIDELGGDKAAELLVKQLTSFRELSFHSLRFLGATPIGWSKQKSQRISQNYVSICSLEDELRALLSSPSWHLTRPLRELRRLLGNPSEHDRLSNGELDENADILLQQERYIQYLSHAIVKVKNSRSWKLTRPLRHHSRRSNSEN
jgi:glycosyltransferase involved in cell wall biosynthesis